MLLIMTLEHIDFASGETVEAQSFTYTGDGFEPADDDALAFEERYSL